MRPRRKTDLKGRSPRSQYNRHSGKSRVGDGRQIQALPEQTENQSSENQQRQKVEDLEVELARVRQDLRKTEQALKDAEAVQERAPQQVDGKLREELRDMMASKDAALAEIKEQQEAAVEAESEHRRRLVESRQATEKEQRAKLQAEQDRSGLEQQLAHGRKDKGLLEARLEKQQEEWKEWREAEAKHEQGCCDQERQRFKDELAAEAEACQGRFEAEEALQEECQRLKAQLQLSHKEQESAVEAEHEHQRQLMQAAKMQAEQEGSRLEAEARLGEALKEKGRIQLALDSVAERLERMQLGQEKAAEERKQEKERWNQDRQRFSTGLEAAALKEQDVAAEAEACRGRFDEELREARRHNANLKQALDAFRALQEEAFERKEQQCGDLDEECQRLRTQSACFAAREGQSEEECERIESMFQQLEQKASDLHEECQYLGTELEKAGKDRQSLQDSLMMVVQSKTEALSERQQASMHAAEARGQLQEECQRLKAQLQLAQKEQESAVEAERERSCLEEEHVSHIVEQEQAAKKEHGAEMQAERRRQECLRHELEQARKEKQRAELSLLFWEETSAEELNKMEHERKQAVEQANQGNGLFQQERQLCREELNALEVEAEACRCRSEEELRCFSQQNDRLKQALSNCEASKEETLERVEQECKEAAARVEQERSQFQTECLNIRGEVDVATRNERQAFEQMAQEKCRMHEERKCLRNELAEAGACLQQSLSFVVESRAGPVAIQRERQAHSSRVAFQQEGQRKEHQHRLQGHHQERKHRLVHAREEEEHKLASDSWHTAQIRDDHACQKPRKFQKQHPGTLQISDLGCANLHDATRKGDVVCLKTLLAKGFDKEPGMPACSWSLSGRAHARRVFPCSSFMS